MAQDENIYYNINLINNSATPASAIAAQDLTGPIVNDAREYYLSAIRFVLDGSTIPIFTFDTNAYWVTLSAPDEGGNIIYSSIVVVNPYVNDPDGNSIYSFTAFLEMINRAFSGAALALGIDPPFLLYDADNQRIALYAPVVYPGHSNVYMNTALYTFFNNYYAKINSYGAADHRDVQIFVADLHGANTVTLNGVSYLKMDQEYSSLFCWFEYTTILFLSNSIGIRHEFSPTNNNTSALTTNNTAGTGVASMPIMTDFQPYYAIGDPAGPRGYLYYTPTGPYRLMNLLKKDIQQIDIRIQLRSRTGATVDYKIPPFQTVTLKLAFGRKTMYGESGSKRLRDE